MTSPAPTSSQYLLPEPTRLAAGSMIRRIPPPTPSTVLDTGESLTPYVVKMHQHGFKRRQKAMMGITLHGNWSEPWDVQCPHRSLRSNTHSTYKIHIRPSISPLHQVSSSIHFLYATITTSSSSLFRLATSHFCEPHASIHPKYR